MKNYIKDLTWAVVSVIDRSTQDDHKSKIKVAGLFADPIIAQDLFIPHLPNEECKRYIIHIDDLEEFETVYNQFQDIHIKYGDYAIFHIKDLGFDCDKENKYREILEVYTSIDFQPKRSKFGASAGDGLPALMMVDQKIKYSRRQKHGKH